MVGDRLHGWREHLAQLLRCSGVILCNAANGAREDTRGADRVHGWWTPEGLTDFMAGGRVHGGR
jgi:hypothetical protein